MPEKEDRKEEAADELEQELEERDEARRMTDRARQEDLNQGMQTGTHDAGEHSINWGPSYRMPKKITKTSDTKDKK